MKKIFLYIPALFFFSLAQTDAYAQDNLQPHYLLERIARLQVREDPFFLPGIFPSYITSTEKFSRRKKDNNIFFNGLITYILKNDRSYLSPADQVLVDTIVSREQSLFASFRNRNGRNTYNFWRTDAAYPFPYTWWIHILKKSTDLPDDMDDTVFSLFALDASDSSAEMLHQLMQNFTGTDGRNVRISNPAFRKLPVYSSWFGKKFPVVPDICVLCNILTFVQIHRLGWTAADSASLQFICQAIGTGEIIRHPLQVSPYYGKTAIILYHIARLMAVHTIPQLEILKPRLIGLAVQQLAGTENILEKSVLASAVLKWGYQPPEFQLPALNELPVNIEENDFPFFIGDIPSYLKKTARNFLQVNRLGLFYHYCPAFNDALLLDYLILLKK